MNQPPLFGSGAGLEPVRFYPDFASWRHEARRLLRHGRPPNSVWWQADRTCSPRTGAERAEVSRYPVVHVPRAFQTQAQLASLNRRDDRWTLLYRLLWRLAHGERHLLERVDDAEVRRLRDYAKAVRRDLHKMKAFVRFRVADDGRYVAWFEPEHHIVERAAGFFRRRFATMRWSILTPDRCAHWEGAGEVWFSEGVSRAAAPSGDAFEAAWRRYYRSIFNPARLKLHAMTAEMPKKYWKNLPEAAEIPELIRHAPARTSAMIAASAADDVLRCGPRPPPPEALLARERARHPEGSLEALRTAALGCRRCPLWEPATQTVFGEGPEDARLMLVGEQPGDREDLVGRPFVGPAGQLLDRALAEAGIERGAVYLTNAVKHFRFKPVGKRRLHDRPREGEIRACASWLDAEIERVRPELIVCLGATAARARLRLTGALTPYRGKLLEQAGRRHLVTVHPSYLLRIPDRRAADAAYARFVEDLALAGRVLGGDQSNRASRR